MCAVSSDPSLALLFVRDGFDLHPGLPWVFHMLVVILFAFIFSKYVRPRWVSVVVSIGIGILLCKLMSDVDVLKGAEHHWYYVDLFLGHHYPTNGTECWKKELHPHAMLGWGWLAPVILASVTVWLGTRERAEARRIRVMSFDKDTRG